MKTIGFQCENYPTLENTNDYFFWWQIHKNIYFVANSLFSWKQFLTKWKKLHKIVIIAHTMEGCLRFDTFIFQTLPNLAKYIWIVITWTTSQNWNEKHPYQCNPLFFKEKSCGWGLGYIEPWPRAPQIKETNFDIDLMPTRKKKQAKEYLHVENC
jgi:hypothetical protein